MLIDISLTRLLLTIHSPCNQSMADLIPSDGTDLTSEKLQRIILGGNHPTVREKLKSQ